MSPSPDISSMIMTAPKYSRHAAAHDDSKIAPLIAEPFSAGSALHVAFQFTPGIHLHA
jgi:hypothetical protein